MTLAIKDIFECRFYRMSNHFTKVRYGWSYNSKYRHSKASIDAVMFTNRHHTQNVKLPQLKTHRKLVWSQKPPDFVVEAATRAGTKIATFTVRLQFTKCSSPSSRSRDSSVGTVTALRARIHKKRGSNPGRGREILFSETSRPALGPTQPTIQGVPRALSSREQSGRSMKLTRCSI